MIQPSLLVSPDSGLVGSEGFETASTVVVGKLVGVAVAVVVEVEMVVGVDVVVVVVVVEDVEEVFDLVVVVLEVVDDLAVVGVAG